MNIVKILEKVALASLPMLGIILQLYYIIDAYMSYTSVTEITQMRDNYFKPPALVLCVRCDYSVQNWKNGSMNKLIEKFPNCDFFDDDSKCTKTRPRLCGTPRDV